ncbi:MAG: serine--tRNA ligase [Candidatus Moranbacteria bacterium CG_4_8_14_3_um_filter_43_15]|nr:MAG: serine--tRNA ligase [Candidatus Moranbacteria bacterium CG_4_8_14_3_um_filter_43_15]
MLDIEYIRENKEAVKKNCRLRNIKCDVGRLLELDEKRRKLIGEIGEIKEKRNELNEEMKKVKDKKDLIEKGKELKENLEKLKPELEKVEKEWKTILWKVPNVISDDTPIGKDESGNKVIRKWGEIPKFDFQPKEHGQLGEELDIIDIPRAAKVSGSRFNFLKNEAALLEFALIQHAFSILTNEDTLKGVIKEVGLDVSAKSFIPVVPPVLIKPGPMERMARLEPREERYYAPADDLYLIGSAEHTLGAMYMDEIIKEEDLPMRFIGFSTAFRREAGSYGKDTKGILRVHQFDKLEMESFCLPENSIEEQNFIVAIQEYLMQSLRLSYQVVAICTGDLGGPDYRQIDIETWLPGQNRYRETHTSDLMNDYQSRRLNTKVRKKNGKLEYVHMNDATAFAIGRTIIAIIENYQQADGSVVIPEVLRKWMPGNLEKIEK